MANFSLLIFLFLVNILPAQVQLNHILLQNVNVDNKVLKIDYKSATTATQIILGWSSSNGQQSFYLLDINPGYNSFDLSFHPGWIGTLPIVVTNNPNISAELKEVGLFDRINIFLNPNYINPTTINFAAPYSFAGIEFRYVLLSAAFLISIILLLLKFDWPYALFIGFIIAVVLLNIRQFKNEIAIFNKFETQANSIDPFIEIQTFTQHIPAIIQGESWSKDELSGVLNSYVKYHLAEYKYVNRKDAKANDYVITNNPGQSTIIYQYSNFYLIRL